MAKIKVGIGRFYNGDSCKLVDSIPITWKQSFPGIEVKCTLAPKTNLPLAPFEFTKKQTDGKSEIKYKYPSEDKYPLDLYFEVLASTFIEITNHDYLELLSNNFEIREKIFKKINEYENELKEALNYTCCFLSLHLTSDLVSNPILELEQKYIFMNDTYFSLQSCFGVEVKNEFLITNKSKKSEYEILKINPQHNKQYKNSVISMEWMLKGWASKDSILKFICFFTALERLIPNLEQENTEFNREKKAILTHMEELGIFKSLPAYVKNWYRTFLYLKGLKCGQKKLN